MAFVPWKDRVTSTPHRYKLTEVSADTYDLEAVPGSISEAGIPVNAANLDKLIQRDGDDIKDTVVAFTEASSRANIGTGESTATLFGKIKKWYTDLKTHAFTAPSTTQGIGTTTVPCDKLLRDSSFVAVYRTLTDSRLTGLTTSSTPADIAAAMADNSILEANTTGYANVVPTGITESTNGVITIHRVNPYRCHMYFSYQSTSAARLFYATYRSDTGLKGWYENISSEGIQDISGVKTYSASPIVPTTPSGPSAAVAKSYADSIGFARVYREATEISGITYPVAIGVLCQKLSTENLLNTYMVIGCSAGTETKVTGLPVIDTTAQTYGQLIIRVPGTSNVRIDIEYTKHTGTGAADIKWIGDLNRGTTPWTVNWKMIIDDSSAQKISGVKEYTASPIVPTTPSGPSAAVAKSYVDGLYPYSKVIRNQTEFEALIGDPSGTWLGAVSVALVGEFTLSTANSGIKIPATVKQIHGYNGAKITVTNFVYNSSTAKGGLWYATRPTTLDYSIRDLEVNCTGTGDGRGFHNCTNLTNCTGTGTGTGATGDGFRDCTNLTNCTGTGTGTGDIGNGFGFCTNLTNCTGTGTGTGTTSGYGFYNCTNLTNCTGTGTGGTEGYGFYYITIASNCRAGGVSSTNMWGGTNKNIDLDTCRKTPVAVTSGELTTLNI